MTDATSSAAHRAVVGFDGSANSVSALEWALDFVSRSGGGTVVAVMSWTFSPTAGVGYGLAGYALPPAESMQEASEGALADALAGVVAPAGVTLESVVREGPPAKVLVDESEGADLLVVGKRGHGGFLGLLMGSVTTQVANHATCPLVIVPAPE